MARSGIADREKVDYRFGRSFDLKLSKSPALVMSQFTKDSELDSTLASGIQSADRRSGSTHFDQRRTVNASGVVVDTANAVTYVADGNYGISDYYPLTFNATGILQVNIREHNSCGDVIILNAAGTEVLKASPSKYSSRNSTVTTTTVNASGAHYAYIQLLGRNSSEYKIGIDLYGG